MNPTVAILTVTFNPDIDRLRDQLNAFPAHARWIIVDNASSPSLVSQLEQLVSTHLCSKLIRNQRNLGLAAAINQAAAAAQMLSPPPIYLLLMDQDSIPLNGAIDTLLSYHLNLEKQGIAVGSIGPRLIDRSSGLQHGFHSIQGWRWTRNFPSSDEAPVSCSNLNGSGTLVRTDLFFALGGLDESLFIDHVDTEWAFRVLASNRKLYGVPAASFDHTMGERSLRYWLLGWRIWPQRSPQRHYYLYRNAIWLMKRSYVPRVWKFWAAIKLLLTFAVHCTLDPQRTQQAKQICSGIGAGIRNKKNNTKI